MRRAERSVAGGRDRRVDYDVLIMGGGPAGASLGARLARETTLRIAICEAVSFPRDHIGESLASPVVPCLQEIGVLARLLALPIHVRKYGGYYSWDAEAPSVSFFRHRLWERDGHHRWSLHVNRAEFDECLLSHASASGAHVVNRGVSAVTVREELTEVRLRDGTTLTTRIFVDASGRSSTVSPARGKAWLSGYRNVAVWGHFTGGRAAQSLPGDWNIFRQPDLSPIGCFAFEHGWCWYIPVPMLVDGRRIATHSIGIVTDPRLLRRPSTRFTELPVFLRTLHEVPLLRDLVRGAQPIYQTLRTATNYSMISRRFSSYDERWLLLGDAAFFVDPLFSSGVSFAMLQAAAASEIIKGSFLPDLPDALGRDLWDDYHDLWAATAWRFALGIDQWYAAIARNNPNSVYWSERASNLAFETRHENFHSLLDGNHEGDLFHVITKGTDRVATLDPDGPFRRMLVRMSQVEPSPESLVGLAEDGSFGAGLTLQMRADAVGNGRPDVWGHGPYWEDPQGRAAEVERIFGAPTACYRFRAPGADRLSIVVAEADASARMLVDRLRLGPEPFGVLQRELPPGAWQLLLRLLLAGVVTQIDPATASPVGA
jgi:flavin-dependent dehydrogenase